MTNIESLPKNEKCQQTKANTFLRRTETHYQISNAVSENEVHLVEK